MSSTVIPYLTEQYRRHPALAAEDVAKLCYQAARGAEHLLTDLDRARAYLERELALTPADGEMPLAEPISDEVARVNLAAWKARGLAPETLFALFAATASVRREGEDPLPLYLREVGEWLSSAQGPVTPEAWQAFLGDYEARGCPAIHHSDAYRGAEHPAYRIVRRDLLAREGLA